MENTAANYKWANEGQHQRRSSYTGGMRRGPFPFALEGPLDDEDPPLEGLAGGPFFVGDGEPFLAWVDPLTGVAETGAFFFLGDGVPVPFGAVGPPGS